MGNSAGAVDLCQIGQRVSADPSGWTHRRSRRGASETRRTASQPGLRRPVLLSPGGSAVVHGRAGQRCRHGCHRATGSANRLPDAGMGAVPRTCGQRPRGPSPGECACRCRPRSGRIRRGDRVGATVVVRPRLCRPSRRDVRAGPRPLGCCCRVVRCWCSRRVFPPAMAPLRPLAEWCRAVPRKHPGRRHRAGRRSTHHWSHRYRRRPGTAEHQPRRRCRRRGTAGSRPVVRRAATHSGDLAGRGAPPLGRVRPGR